MRTLTIGTLARKTGVSTDTVRFYQKLRLITAADQTGSGYRLYAESAVRRILFIRHAQRCGFALSDIAALLSVDGREGQAATCGLAVAKKREVDENLKVLELISATLASYIEHARSGRASQSCSDEHPLVIAFASLLDDSHDPHEPRPTKAAPLNGSRRAC